MGKNGKGLKIPKGQMEPIVTALRDIGRNRLAGAFALEVFGVKKVAADELAIVLDAKDALIKAYAPDGEESIKPDDEGWESFVKAINEMYADEAALDVKPLELKKLEAAENWQAMPDSLGILNTWGLLV